MLNHPVFSFQRRHKKTISTLTNLLIEKFRIFARILILEMGTLFFYLFLALGISFFCSLMESVLLSTPLSFINMLEAEGRNNAELLRKYKEDIYEISIIK